MKVRFRTVFAIAIAVAFAVPAAGAAAQRPAGADTLSSAAVAESLKVLATIRAQLDKRQNRNDAPLWYHRGMLTWALYLRDRANGGLRELDWTLLGREMDSSIRIASELAPQNVRYQLTKGQFFASSGWLLTALQARHVFDVALQRARASRDPQLIAEAAIEKGIVHWRRYEGYGFGFAPRPLPAVTSEVRPIEWYALSRLDARNREVLPYNPRDRTPVQYDVIGRDFNGKIIPRKDGEFSGEMDYIKAEAYFREAYGAMPTYVRAYAELAMLLEERQRYGELLAMTRERLAAEPRHAWAWMTLGLTFHRTGKSTGALAAFDSGLKYLVPGERRRIDNIARVMRPMDSAMVRAWTPAERTAFEDWYWVWSAPLWSLEETKPRAEFLSRVTTAELRWTTDDFARRGADTDRGNVFVRYGPTRGGRGAFGAEAWLYDYSGLAFHFRGVPGFGTAYFDNEGTSLNVMDSIPARWDNLVRARVDTLPMRVARFRASPGAASAQALDSIDIAFSFLPPVEAIRKAADVDGPVNVTFWLFNDGFPKPQHDTSALRTGGAVMFSRRLPQGSYMYRVEATSDAATLGARASSRVWAKPDSVAGFYTSGFGISDLLIGARAVPRGVPKRWTDFDFDPAPGEFAQGAELALIWENYELGERDGSVSYSVRFIIERKWQMFLNRVRARVTNAFAAMLGREESSERVIFRYERSAPHAAAIPDYITLDLADTPAGFYDVTIEVTDRVTGRMTSRTTRVRISD